MRYKHLLLLALLSFVAPGPLQALPLETADGQTSDIIGLHQSLEEMDEYDGQTVSLGMVELCLPDTDEQPGFNFMPNLAHQALANVNLQDVYYYHNKYHPARYSSHATMIAGILLGDDPEAKLADAQNFVYRGIIPRAKLSIYETNWFIYKRIIPQSQPVSEDILTISWGTDANDVITSWWQRGIDALIERDACVVIAGCGNGRDQFSSITKPSAGYNVISVGAACGLGHFPDNINYIGPPRSRDSNFGPTADGRTKPDVIAPGLHIGPDADNQTRYRCQQNTGGYSSFASPVVAGLAGVLIDAARKNNLDRADDPRLIKALILNGAHKLTGWHKGAVGLEDDATVPLDYAQGAGLVNIANSLDQLLAGRFAEQDHPEKSGWDMVDLIANASDPKAMKKYLLPEPLDPNAYVKATICWYRHYQQDRIFRALPVRPFDLELWRTDENGRLLKLLDQSRSPVDNLQHIYYRSDHTQSVALVIRAADDTIPSHVSEQVALAYMVTDDNWPGDVMAEDLNADGIVDQTDARLLLQQIKEFSQTGTIALTDNASVQTADLNHDGKINTDDFLNLIQVWNQVSVWHEGP